MSCKYCNEYADITATVTDVSMRKYQAYIAPCISLDGYRLARLVFTDNFYEWETEIKFCPMCGANLSEGSKQ